MEKKTVRDINVKGKKVLVRVDYNVPMNDKGEITDTIRIDATLPTLNYLLDQGAATGNEDGFCRNVRSQARNGNFLFVEDGTAIDGIFTAKDGSIKINAGNDFFGTG